MRRVVSKNSLKGLYDQTVKNAWATVLNSWGVSPDECNRKFISEVLSHHVIRCNVFLVTEVAGINFRRHSWRRLRMKDRKYKLYIFRRSRSHKDAAQILSTSGSNADLRCLSDGIC